MSDLSIEAETRRPLKSRKGSSSAEEDSSAGNCSGGIQLKKGPWTSAEDAILIEYVTKHGEGNWNAVQKDSGLSRCGKSCRLRWANHLRPDLRKGAFSPEEEHLIIELHARMGNKWARMAAELPGRTDNEIKNYWNTRIKRMQRAGKPVYPPEIRAQAMNEGHQSPDVELSMSGEENLLEPSIKNFDIPAIEFKQLELAHGYVNSSTALPNLPARSILHNDQCSSLGFLLPIHPHKGLREVETAFPGSIGSIGDSFSVFDQHEDDTYGENSQPFWSSSYAPNPNINNFSRVDMLPSNHALTNGNSSSSKPVYMAMKLELPSLQYSASQVGNWAPSSPIPSLESVDTLIQSPLSDQAQSNCPSPRNSGLLEAIVYESQYLNTASEKPIRHFSKALAGDDLLASSSPIFVETTSDPISPFGQSSASGLFDYTPISGSSSEETQSIESMQGMKDKAEMDILRPDMLFDSCWYWYPTGFNKGPSMAAELGTHFADDLNFDLDK